MDRFTSLALFAAAVEEGSLAGAGRRLGLSPAAAGKHVSALEAHLQVRLLQRSTRRLVLTEAGQSFLPRCRRMLDELDEARREAGDLHRVVRGTLRVAAPTAFGVLRLGEAVARYALDHPEVRVELRLDDRYVDLVEQEVDIAVRIGCLTDSALVTRRLGACRLVLCASPAFIARHGLPQTPEDLRRLPRLAFSESVSAGDWSFIAEDGAVHAVNTPATVSANNVQVLAAVAASGAGVAYGPEFVFRAGLDSGALVQLLPRYATPLLDIHAAFPTARHLPQKVRRFVDYLAEHLDVEMAARAEVARSGVAPQAEAKGRQSAKGRSESTDEQNAEQRAGGTVQKQRVPKSAAPSAETLRARPVGSALPSVHSARAVAARTLPGLPSRKPTSAAPAEPARKRRPPKT